MMTLNSLRLPAMGILLLLLSLIVTAADDIDIPYTKFVLDNGLTLVVHEDNKAPIVAVNIWYHVGSKNERPGRTGFAHLFEHLMFQGSENFHGDYLSFLPQLGATDLNGSTWFDRTNYYQTVPKNALDTVLWLESDRMGHFIDSVDQDKLDEQRGVVQNEKRQGDNQPYGKVWEDILRKTFPAEHPYAWETIGSMEDLNAASLADVKNWFQTYYGPDNAVLVIAGDVDTEQVLARVEHFFGDIPAGPPLIRPEVWIPRHTDERRVTMEDRVSQARLYKTWTGPNWGAKDAHLLEMVADILGNGKNSRLYRRMVYEDQIATEVSINPLPFEISGLTYLEVTAQPGMNLDKIEAVVNEEIALLIRKGPSKQELKRIQQQKRTDFLRNMERIGGGSGKSATLARNMVYGGSPDAWKTELQNVANATRKDLKRVAKRWLETGALVTRVVPVPDYRTSEQSADRSGPPVPAGTVDVDFPKMEREQLANGLNVIVVRRSAVPLVNLSLILDAGYAADQEVLPGTATVTLSMLDEGTINRSATKISTELDNLSASITAGSNLDSSFVDLVTLSSNLGPSLEIFSDIVLNPTFPEHELKRVRKLYLAAIQQEKTSPLSMALRVTPRLLYGSNHAYGQSMTGLGSEAELNAISRQDLTRFHDTWFHPGQATIVVVGDTSMSEILPLIRRQFGSWPSQSIPEKNIGTVEQPYSNTLYVIDRPGSDQSVIFGGQLVAPTANPQEQAIQAMNDILGGMSSARINMNLREDKHWSYGAFSFMRDARGQRPFLVYAPVQTDKTAESVQELLREIGDITEDRPPSEAELELVKRSNTLSLPGRWETARSVLSSVSEIVRYELPTDYWAGYADRVNSLSLAEVIKATSSTLKPEKFVWVVIGDLSRIETGLRELGFDRLQLINADGELME